jgi:short-subunit dehydrogenase
MNILITGATDGIGLALARQYHAQNTRLILVGRKALSELDPVFFNADNYCQADLSQPDAAAQIATWLDARQIQSLDLVVHNAGQGWYGDPRQQSPKSVDNLLRINVYAPLELTHRLLPRLHNGQVVFISSVAADAPAPLYAVYAATKSAQEGFARSLRVEAVGRPIVQVIRLGAARTGMHAKSGVPAGKFKVEKFPSAEATAANIIRAIARRKPGSVTIGAGNVLLHWVGRHFPAFIDALAGGRA